MKRTAILLSLCLVSSLSANFNHKTNFEKLPPEASAGIHETYYKGSTSWYIKNYHVGRYSGYMDLYKKYEGYLPSGKGLTILQVENNPVDAKYNPVHLFNTELTPDYHSKRVSKILTEITNDPYTKYTSFSMNLDKFHSATSADLGKFIDDTYSSSSNTLTYPKVDASGNKITEIPKLLNISNSFGSGYERIRLTDKFISDNDIIACTAESGTYNEPGITTSGNLYNSLVVGFSNPIYGNKAGAFFNDHG